MAHFSKRLGRWITGRGGSAPHMPDPFSPNSPDYAERHRETRRIILSGTLRVDIGEPVAP